MRICERALNFLQIVDHEGTTRLCAWIRWQHGGGEIGKLKDASLYDLWHGEKAKELRNKLDKSDYSWCNIDQCPFLSMGTIEDHRIELEDIPEYPNHLWLAFERNCNYSCTCCYTPVCKDCASHKEREEGYINIENKIKDVLPHVKYLAANGMGELFTSPHILKLISEWKPLAPAEDITVLLETNGSLFDEKHWKQIENIGKYHVRVSITVMSFDEATYQFCSGTKLPIKQLEDNLRFVKSLREKEIINYLELATVVQERNFRTLPELTRRFIEEFGADTVRLRPFDDVGAQAPEVEWFMDVRGAYHPYHQEYLAVMKDPIFKHPKVRDWSGGRDSENPDLRTYLAQHGAPVGSREQVNYDVVKIFAAEEKIEERLADYFKDKGIAVISVYGMGYPGKAFLKVMHGSPVKYDRLIDKTLCGESIYGVTVSNISEISPNYSLPIVVTAPFFFDEIKAEITRHIPNAYILNIKEIIEEILCKGR